MIFEAGEAAFCSCCAWYTLVDENARRASAWLLDRWGLSYLLERRGFADSRKEGRVSGGRC